ncbi:hypothetical protein W02_38290 [Nitrospira sp. KM1]|uniref:hypothetical protein n=1 Tax=Nitrospira sp. KM1 TaxID=1936990 RepID=UPI0013A75D32|nr:hypothetical protein [Nitrospira sp. KM1]BCA56689.1 hypothetical protein W02_38290 [Nitrospira sp. KM1]
MASEDKINKFLLEKFAGLGTPLAAILLRLDITPSWADGTDIEGRTIVLIGRHLLGSGPEAEEVSKLVLDYLAVGGCPDLVHPIAFAPSASRAIAEAVDGSAEEILVHGPRGTGKTHALAAAAVINAELDLRAGYPGPYRVLWLHDTLLSASAKTARSLELPMWGNTWSLKDDRKLAVFSVGGKQMVVGDFVGCQDQSSAERLRMSANTVIGEEPIASLTDGLGITEQQYDLARSSTLRLPTRRRVSMLATNPGSPDTWPHRRFFHGSTKSLPIQISVDDRLTQEERQALEQTFANSPTLQKRLAKGEWVMAEQGAAVAEGFNPDVHVSPYPLVPSPMLLFAIGWDGGHSPSAVMGQNLSGQARIYASLNDMKVGVLELIERQVLPWLQAHAPWALTHYGAQLVHIIDPNMATPGQATITETAEKVIREKLGGRIVHGPVRWAPRREAILRGLGARHEQGRTPLLIAPGDDTRLLVEAFSGRWFYPVLPNGQVDRTGPKKPNSPWADVSDAAAYLLSWLHGDDLMTIPTGPLKVETHFTF